MDITEQLIRIYNDELDNSKALTELEARRYYSKMLAHGRINVYIDSGEVIGLLESWRLDYEQLGRVICWTDFNAISEDVSEGPVAYVSDVWVKEDHRDGNILKMLKFMFQEKNQDAEHFISRRVKSKAKYVRVYSKDVGYKDWIKEGDNNGR